MLLFPANLRRNLEKNGLMFCFYVFLMNSIKFEQKNSKFDFTAVSCAGSWARRSKRPRAWRRRASAALRRWPRASRTSCRGKCSRRSCGIRAQISWRPRCAKRRSSASASIRVRFHSGLLARARPPCPGVLACSHACSPFKMRAHTQKHTHGPSESGPLSPSGLTTWSPVVRCARLCPPGRARISHSLLRLSEDI